MMSSKVKAFIQKINNNYKKEINKMKSESLKSSKSIQTPYDSSDLKSNYFNNDNDDNVFLSYQD